MKRNNDRIRSTEIQGGLPPQPGEAEAALQEGGEGVEGGLLEPPLQQVGTQHSVEMEIGKKFFSNTFLSRVAARIPTGFGMRKFKRKNVLMSNDFICVVKAKKK